MPLMDKRSNLTPANGRAVDVSRRLTESIAPLQQQRYLDAFRVQGISAIHYVRLNSGRPCTCHQKNTEVSRLSDDGKASQGAINRVLTGNDNFGVSSYTSIPKDLTVDPYDAPTSPDDPFSSWMGDLNFVGKGDGDLINQAELEPTVGDNGQFSPDMDNLFGDFDMSMLGISDVSCPICFGSNYVGGYSPFRTWRHVLVPSDLETASFYELPDMELSAGTHTATVTLPRGGVVLDVFRTMLKDKATVSKFYLDGMDITNRNLLSFCDGLPHQLTIVTEQPLTHVEIQIALSKEPIYFEIPKLTKNSDISFLEQQEPFQIIVSPDVPFMQSLDVIAESQLGKMLVVQSVNPWNTRNRQLLGWECQVRVAQPQELWRILPFRRHITGTKRTAAVYPSKTQTTSGLSALKGLVY